MNRRTVLIVSLAFSTLAVAGCSTGVRADSARTSSPAPTVTVTAQPETEVPEWGFLAEIEDSGMKFTDDYVADMRRFEPGYEDKVNDEWVNRVCNTSLNDGIEGGYHFGARTDKFWFSQFYNELSSLKGSSWDVARTVAYHNCPSRFEVVTALENFKAS
ncbi:hypothetical protein [Citricoccus sp. I39-566]|uniref:hypothetical protein n=1 Tax=Citricoccus sp. I39-566 TaxID=3073268 RepID=UPI00286A18F3|nr:hypothetical protein [Citricoccus sp. I39-566]WMY80086.1 hypothetical protein RE421_16565 [Citricoccus sp. I39-566]